MVTNCHSVGYRYGNCTSLPSFNTFCDGFTDQSGGYLSYSFSYLESSDELVIFLSLIEEPCRTIVARFICLFYYPPCGNHTHFIPPQSICMEDCLVVVEMCSAEVQLLNDFLLLQALEFTVNITETGLFDCSRTDVVISPLPHCCTAGGYVHFYIRVLYTNLGWINPPPPPPIHTHTHLVNN